MHSVYFRSFLGLGFLFWAFSAGGCGPGLSSPEQLREFEKAGPVRSEADYDSPVGIKGRVGPYQVIRGDILEFQMPAVLRVISSDLPEWLRPVFGRRDVEPYLVRVSQAGTITLPIVGEMPAAGKTLAEIEACVIDAYFPKYVVNPPMVVCQVKEYRSANQRVFAVMGLVNKAGVFPYPADVKYSLMEALAFAGGLDMVADPRYVKIYRKDITGQAALVTVKINKKALADACSLTIKPGDLVYVDHTLRTRVNKFLSDVFHITIGAESRYTSD
jgi:protein involved in polysaccharide export with SLBB domain